MTLSNQVVLLTGSTGFIGTRVLALLIKSGVKVVTLTRNPLLSSNHPLHTNIQADLENLSVSQIIKLISPFKPTTLCHLAWQGIPDYSQEVSITNNLISTKLISAFADLSTAKKAVVAGSCFEVKQNTGSIDETHEPLPTDYFTWAKTSIYHFLRLLCRQRGIEYNWARIFFCYGPGQRPGSLLPSVLSAIRSSKESLVSSPNDVLDFIHVDDVASAIFSCTQSTSYSGILNLGSGAGTSVGQVIQELLCHYPERRNLVRLSSNTPAKLSFWSKNKLTTSVLSWQPHHTIASGIQSLVNTDPH